jgi:hypothetical protein
VAQPTADRVRCARGGLVHQRIDGVLSPVLGLEAPKSLVATLLAPRIRCTVVNLKIKFVEAERVDAVIA